MSYERKNRPLKLPKRRTMTDRMLEHGLSPLTGRRIGPGKRYKSKLATVPSPIPKRRKPKPFTPTPKKPLRRGSDRRN